MSQTDNSFLTTPDDPTVQAVESPELDFSAVESPTVDSPGLFEYEGPFNVGPREGDLWFELRRKEKRELRLQARLNLSNFYANLDLDTKSILDGLEGPDFEGLDGFNFGDLGIEIPDFDPNLRLEDIFPQFGGIDIGEIDFSTGTGIKKYIEGYVKDLTDYFKEIDFFEFDGEKIPEFEGYGTAGKAAHDAIGQTVNFYKNPTLNNADALLNSLNNASEAFEKIGFTKGSELAKLHPQLAGALLDVGAISDIASFVDDPSLVGAAGAFNSANYILDNLGIESLPGADSDIARLAGNAVTVLTAATELDKFFKDPSLTGALSTSAAVANAAAVFGGTSTAATATQIANFLNPITMFVAGVGLIRGLTHDADYSRSDGIVSYKNGKFETTFLNGADGGSLAYTHWADAQTHVATNALNSLMNDYGFEVDNKKMSQIFNSHMNKSYITNNPQYAMQGGRNHSSSGVDMVLSLLKAGALKPGKDTPAFIVSETAVFGQFMGNFFKQMTNDAAAYMMDNGGYISRKGGRLTPQQKLESQTYLPFADKQSAQAYIDKKGLGLKKGKLQAIGSKKVTKTTSKAILGFNISGHSINADNSIKPTTITYNVGEEKYGGKGKYTNQYTKTFKTEAEAKKFVSENSGKIEKGRRREGKGYTYYETRTDYAYILHEGQYIIGERKVEL